MIQEAKEIVEHDTGCAAVAQSAVLVTSDGRADRVTIVIADPTKPLQRDPDTGQILRDGKGNALPKEN